MHPSVIDFFHLLSLDLEVSSLQANFQHSVPLESSGSRLLTYAAEPFFYARLSFVANTRPKSPSRSLWPIMFTTILGLLFFGFASLYKVQSELAKLNNSPI